MAWHDSWASMKKKRPQETDQMESWSMDEFGDQSATTTNERVDLPEGIHELAIKTVADDPTQLVLELAHDDRRFWWAKVSLKKNAGWARGLVKQLIAALAMTEQEWEAAAPDDLTGRRVMVEIRHRTGNTGRVFVNVVGFSAIPQLADEAAAAAKRPARTPAARVKAASPGIGSDDIPFGLILAIASAAMGVLA